MKRPIYERLLQFQKEDRYPFHMPGHKRRLENELSTHMFQWDITEIDGFDELFDPAGIIKESMEELRKFYQTEKTWYLVNGSSCGNMAACGAVFQRGESILLARNCHKSVYQAVELFGLRPYYVYPSYETELGMYGPVSPCQVEEQLKRHREIKGVFLTSPTYEGIVSDIETISQICKKYNAILVVDEAHGAHFPFSDFFPDSAVTKGADLVIQSLHKTMAVPNQGALLHLCTNRVEEERVSRYQAMFQTTSPSYVLLASMEYGVFHGRTNKNLWHDYENCLLNYRKKWEKLKKLHVVKIEDFKESIPYDYDRGKLVITSGTGKITGKELAKRLLLEYGLQMEMSEKNYVIAMTSYLDSEEAFCRLDNALENIDQTILEEKKSYYAVEMEACEMKMTPLEAVEKKREWVDIQEATGKIAANYVYLYPPGSPILVPGEKINIKVLEKIQEYLYNDMEIKGLQGTTLEIIV